MTTADTEPRQPRSAAPSWAIAGRPRVWSAVRALGRAGLLVGCAYVLFATLPFNNYLTSRGVDSSWNDALNALPRLPYRFGADWVFTYGPLGYLLVPQATSNHLLIGNAFALAVHALFGVGLVALTWQAVQLRQATLTLPTLAIAGALSPYFDTDLLLAVAALVALVLAGRRLAQPAAVACGLLVAITLFTKQSLGAEALTLAAVSGAAGWFVRPVERSRRVAVLLMSTAFAVALLALVAMFARSPAGVLALARGVLALSSGYGVAMSIGEAVGPILLSLAVVAGALGLAIALWRTGDPTWALAAGCVPALYLVWREAFERQASVKVFEFWPLALGLTALLLLTTRRPLAVMLNAAGLAVCGALTLATIGNGVLAQNALSVQPGLVLSGYAGWAHLDALIHLSAVRAANRWASQLELAPDRLPAAWRTELASEHATVDVVPLELGVIPANGLDWEPNPTLQLYASYTASLDRRTATHFQSHGAPDFLVARFEDIDGRNPLLSTPATWRAILDGYQLLDDDPSSGFLLLRRQASPATGALRPLGTVHAASAAPIAVPPSDGPLYAQIDLPLTFAGQLRADLFRVLPVSLELDYASGQSAVYRVTPDTLRDGILVNDLPSNSAGFAALFDGVATDHVVSMRLLGPGLVSYAEHMTLGWLSSSEPIRSIAAPTWPSDPPQSSENTHFHLDLANTLGSPPSGSVVRLSADEPSLTLAGWAVDAPATLPARDVAVTIDGSRDVPLPYGLPRPDVAAVLGNPAYRISGFQGAVTAQTLGPGRHTLTLKILSADRMVYYQPDYYLTVDVP